MLNHKWLWIALALLVWFLAGCGPKTDNVADWNEKLAGAADFAARMGLDFEASGTFGDGHVAGQAFNVTGLHGYWKISGKPIPRSVD